MRTQHQPLQVFISYSRADVAFADRLVAGLEARGLRVSIDKRDLPTLQEWRRELLDFIRNADAVVFIVSARSVASPVCAWEVGEVARLSKRLAPVVLEPVTEDRIPPEISKIHYLYFDPPNDFDTQANRLAAALQTDLSWIKEHTHLGELARRWNERSRLGALVLRGRELDEAERWLVSRPRDAPAATVLQRALIELSRRAAIRRRRVTLVASLGVALMVMSLTGLSYFQREIALQNEKEAVAQRNRALVAQSRFLGDVAEQQRSRGDVATAIALALEALPDATAAGERPLVPEAESSLYESLLDLREISVLAHNVTLGGMSWTGPAGAGQDVGTNEEMIQYALDRLPLGEHMFASMGGVRAMFSQDDTMILTWGNDAARIWRNESGPQSVKLGPGELGVPVAAISPNGLWVLTAFPDHTVRVWSSDNWSEAAILRGHTGGLIGASFNPNGSQVVTGSWDETARVWDVATWRQVLELRGHSGGVSVAMFSRNGSRIVTASDDRTARVWDAGTGQQLAVLSGHTEALLSTELSPDGMFIVTAANDGSARLWDAITGKQLAYLATSDAVRAAFSPDGTRVVIALRSGLARVVDVGTASEVLALRGHGGAVWAAVYSPSGAEILTTSKDGVARLWDSLSGRQIRVFAGHLRGIFGAVFSSDGKRVVTMSFDSTARVWDVERSRQIFVHEPMVTPAAAAATPGGRVLKISQDHSVRILDAGTQVELVVLKGHKGTVFAAALSDDGEAVVTASYDTTARIWHSHSGREIAVLRGHQGSVLSASFSPDGKRVATGSSDGTVRIWDVRANTTVAVIRLPNYEVSRVQFSLDGTRLVTMSKEGDGNVWPLFPDTQSLVNHAKVVIPRCLTERQREIFFLHSGPPRWCIEHVSQERALSEAGKWPYRSMHH